MKVRTQQNFNRKTCETVFGISIMPDNSRGNPFQQDVVGILRALGHVTYDFKYRKCME